MLDGLVAAHPEALAGEPSAAKRARLAEVLRKAGQISGPELLGQLQALTGSTGAGKRLLVRLRHCPEVKVVSGTDSPIYSWIE